MNNKKKSILTLAFLTAIAVATVIFKDARIAWIDITKMIIPDVILSLASVGFFAVISSEKTKAKRIIVSICGFFVPNIFLWGIGMGIKELIKMGKLTVSLSVILMFIMYAVLSVKYLSKNKDENTRFFSKIISVSCCLIMLIGSANCVPMLLERDTEKAYDAMVKKVTSFENDYETALPQTELYSLIKEHFESPLPEGKSEKKCIVIGFDGTRCDVLPYIDEHSESGIKDVLNMNGSNYISYCGGVNYPQENTQDTSTAPGWCSILTGQWADVHGIYENYIPKSNENLTLFTTLVENKTIDSSEFIVSWDGHFNKSDCTYYPEKEYVESKNLNVTFKDTSDDNGTFSETLNNVKNENCTDFLFCILEYCDHLGHASDFGHQNSSYVDAFEKDDSSAHKIISAIKERDTFSSEDWLIIITSDHGGIGAKHGGDSKQERYTFIVANKKIQ